MQTLHLRLQDLRAISLGQSPGRWPTPSAATRDGTKGPPGLSNSPGPTCAVGWRPEQQPQNLDRCPTVGAGLFLVPPFRGASICGAKAPDLRRVCPRQTASELPPYPAPHKAGDLGAVHWQARASEVHCTPSSGLSFSLRPQRCERALRSGARASGKKTVARWPRVSGYLGSGDAGLRATGRLKPASLRKIRGQASSSLCADTPALVTGQEPGGTGVPGDALLRCARALRWRLSSARGEGAWPATTSL